MSDPSIDVCMCTRSRGLELGSQPSKQSGAGKVPGSTPGASFSNSGYPGVENQLSTDPSNFPRSLEDDRVRVVEAQITIRFKIVDEHIKKFRGEADRYQKTLTEGGRSNFLVRKAHKLREMIQRGSNWKTIYLKAVTDCLNILRLSLTREEQKRAKTTQE